MEENYQFNSEGFFGNLLIFVGLIIFGISLFKVAVYGIIIGLLLMIIGKIK